MKKTRDRRKEGQEKDFHTRKLRGCVQMVRVYEVVMKVFEGVVRVYEGVVRVYEVVAMVLLGGVRLMRRCCQ